MVDGGDNEDETIYEGELTLVCGDEGGNVTILDLGRFLRDVGIEACDPDKLPNSRNNYYARRLIEKEGDGLTRKSKDVSKDSKQDRQHEKQPKENQCTRCAYRDTPIKIQPLKGNYFPSPKAAKTGWKTVRTDVAQGEAHDGVRTHAKSPAQNSRRLAALSQLKRSYSLPVIPTSVIRASAKPTPQTESKPIKLRRSNTRRFLDKMNSDKSKPRVMPSIHLKKRFEAHKTRIRSVSVSADPDIILTSADDFCVKLFNFNAQARGILTRGEEQDKAKRGKKIWISPVDGNARELDKLRYATEMIDAVKEFEEEQAADEDKEERKRREIEERRRRHEEAAAGEDEESQVLKEKLHQLKERERLIGQLMGEKTWSLSDAEIGRIQAREDAQAKIDRRKALKAAKRSSEVTEDAEMMELLSDPPPLDELKKLNMYSTGCGLTLDDENNWDIGGTNKQKLLYPKLYGERHRVEVMEEEKRAKLRGPDILKPSDWLLEQYKKHKGIVDQIELKQKR